MPRTFFVKVPAMLPAQAGEYLVVTCPKCGKKTYGVVGQKGKKCPVCRHAFSMPVGGDIQRFKTPEEACRFIQAEETKRAGRLDFAPAAGGFRPASIAPVIARMDKVIAETRSTDAQFATWARQYFATATGTSRVGMPMVEVIAAATKAGFGGAGKLIEKAIASGLLVRPKPYTVWYPNIM